ncbi:uncharacterized protein NFIA_094730 [Aspergillus fischeri NRRL 181]|uniref:Uncharacterized protein n=1 Tax=Neosartorya fischeri (strain ATCC 1020 / DSM 3700 / CBS 544.65 / FGSC A1164 / JCM 1740 / NRRL 181 / WB 181) TaxID=331117 RepID=A1DAG3_NEOFI|nr:uncharacterized protein NFIA_094730 [Aspergillus fischeri NRRL 181]EAW19853.1 hypothetical protein NFIA_094730 [Aspergillus fischeri NRRL 181]
MAYQPSGQDKSARLSLNLPDEGTNFDELAARLHIRGSAWNREHITALRVVPLDECPLSKIYPVGYLPRPNDPAFRELKRSLLAPSLEQLRQWSSNRRLFESNTFSTFFSALSSTMMTAHLTIPGSTRAPSAAASQSPSSDEDGPESDPRTVIQSFLKRIEIRLSPRPTLGARYTIGVVNRDMPLKLELGPPGFDRISANSDGGIALFGRGGRTSSDRPSDVPLVAVQAKRRHAGGLHRGTGQPERFNYKTLGQEVAELLGIACGQDRLLNRREDQEVFLISIHGTQVRLVAAYFTADYLHAVKPNFLPAEQYLWVRRTRAMELKSRQGREEALRNIMGLVYYLYSGEAKMNQIRLTKSQLQATYEKPRP